MAANEAGTGTSTTPAPGAESSTKAFSGSFSADLDFNLGASGDTKDTKTLKTNVEIGYDTVPIEKHKQVVSLVVSKREIKEDSNKNQQEELTPFLALVTATDIHDPDKPTQNFYAHVAYPEAIKAGTQVTISNIQLSITYADQTFVSKMKDIDTTKSKPVLTGASEPSSQTK